MHIDDDAQTSDGLVDAVKMRPIARLGYKDCINVESVFQMQKSTPEDRSRR